MLPGHLGHADNFLVADAVIKENEVALLHSPEIVPRLVIANAVPVGFAFADEVVHE